MKKDNFDYWAASIPERVIHFEKEQEQKKKEKQRIKYALGEHIKQLRLKHNITQKQLAEQLPCSPARAYICQIENGFFPSLNIVKEISKLFNDSEILEIYDNYERINIINNKLNNILRRFGLSKSELIDILDDL